MRTKINGDALVADWGSCQYDEAAEIYHKLLSKQLIEANIVESKRIENPDIIALRAEFTDSLNVLEEAEQADMSRRINQATKPEEFFEIAKDLAFDLWSTIFIVDYFVDYTIKEVIETPVYGPILNMMAQGENFEVGVLCYLLTKHYETAEETFTNFDT
jgi:hypothetical protein